MPHKERRDGKLTGQWVAKIVVHGKVQWCGTHTTKNEARQAEDRKRAELRVLQAVETCDSFAARWVDDYPRRKDTTNAHNRERVKAFGDDFRHRPLNSVTRSEARVWANRHPSRVSSVRAMFTDAVNDELVTRNPFAELRMPQSEGRRNIVVLTTDELNALADAALKVWPGKYGREFRALIIFTAHIGCRPGELFRIHPADIDGQCVHIREQRNNLGQVTSPKNGKARTAALLAPAAEALRDVSHRIDGGPLFRAIQGREFSHGSHHYAWNKVRCVAGRPDLDFYAATRHYAATHLLELGASDFDVSVQLGHEDGGTLVRSTYGHPDKELSRERLLRLHGRENVRDLAELRAAAKRRMGDAS